MKMALKSGQLEVSSSNPELGDAREELDIDYQGPEMAIGFNARYLLDILQVQDDNRIRMLFKDQLSPGLLQPENDQGFLAVVMPMRLCRITSYNVCYTKLLRSWQAARRRPIFSISPWI